jgi:hypothetical protein
VNAITRIVLVLPDMVALFFAFSLMYKAMYALLPASSEKDPDAGEFWALLERREAALRLPSDGQGSLADASAQSMARQQAREEFGLG